MKTLFALLAFASVGSAFADALDQWHWRNPLPTSLPLHGVAFGADRLVAVGEGGWMVTSTNGQDWTGRPSGSQARLNGVAYGNGIFLAYGYEGADGVIMTSTNGLEWNVSTSNIAGWLRDVKYAAGVYVGVGELDLDGPIIVTSADGKNWTKRTSVPGFRRLNGVAFGNGTFAAVGERGLIVSSDDGSNWSEASSDTDRDLFDVTFGNGMFVATGFRTGTSVILTSTDGLSWGTVWSMNTTTAPEPLTELDLRAVSYGGGVFVACGEGHAALTSADGVTWDEHDLGADRILLRTTYGYGHTAVGFALFPGGLISSAVVSSLDVSTWTDRTSGFPSLSVRGLAFGNRQYVAANWGGKVLASTNGANWFPTVELDAPANFFGAAFANGLFLAFGRNQGDDFLFTSLDGIEWTNRAPAGTPLLLSVAYGNGRFVAPRGSTVVWSLDGIDWSKTDSSTATNLRAVMFHEGEFVGVGDEGTVQTSLDGLNWTTHSSGTNSPLRGVAFGNGRYVAVGREVIVNSANATDWSISQTGGWQLLGVAFGGGTFVAVGVTTLPYVRSIILTSEDGVAWMERRVGIGTYLYCVMYDGQTFWIGGDGGAILQSDPVVSPSLGIRLTNGAELILEGAEGFAYRIEFATEIQPTMSWERLTTLEVKNGAATFIDQGESMTTQRFYRATLVP